MIRKNENGIIMKHYLLIFMTLFFTATVSAQPYTGERKERSSDGFVYVEKYNNKIKGHVAAYSTDGKRLTPDCRFLSYLEKHFFCTTNTYHPESGIDRDKLGGYSKVLYNRKGKCILGDSGYCSIVTTSDKEYIWCRKFDGSRVTYRKDGSFYANGHVVISKNTSSKGSSITTSSQQEYKPCPKGNPNPNDKYYYIPTGVGYIEMWIHPDGSSDNKFVNTCYSCRGSKSCMICSGTGNAYNMLHDYHYMVCPACGGMGKCGTCGGKGKTKKWMHLQPGEAEAYLQSKREGRKEGDRSGGASRSVCPNCNGRGFESDSYKNAAASISGWKQPYHNKSGDKCPYCGYTFDHYHYPCNNCHGYGSVSH